MHKTRRKVKLWSISKNILLANSSRIPWPPLLPPLSMPPPLPLLSLSLFKYGYFQNGSRCQIPLEIGSEVLKMPLSLNKLSHFCSLVNGHTCMNWIHMHTCTCSPKTQTSFTSSSSFIHLLLILMLMFKLMFYC